MSGFHTLKGRIAVYNEDNVDTDRIIPARFLSMVTRSGYGELAFKDVRGEGFPLDHADAVGAEILVAGTNFGCGSSREHAVWAIQQAGYRTIIARRTDTSPGYSDIFRQNAANCGLLLVELEYADHRHLVEAGHGAEVIVDLPAQKVKVDGREFSFEISAATKEQMMAGLDLVGTTLVYEPQIAAFEASDPTFVPSS